ncbi:blue copper protein 1a-like [Phragmites australis]|uniref:blue copper protein 1a-like n=1 Tax=Phragmites australis TaxID=29695 RepID=UPI002D79CC35|nr:blue copper protein 1a-like [Phragmites australis]
MASKQMLVVVAAVLAIAFLPSLAVGTEHWVGDESGWSLGFNYSAWAETKRFEVGDTLVFKYTSPSHTVVEVGGVDFAACNKPGDATKLATGEDRVTLDTAGRRWFVCGVGEHCQKGMKLKISVLAADEGTGVAPALAPGSPSTTPPPPASSPAAKVQARLALAVIAATAVIAAMLVF